MGTNLSQVFISNLDTPVNKTAFNDAALFTAPNPAVGIWADSAYRNWGTDAPLYTKSVDTDTSNADDTTVGAITINVNPLWRYKTLQIAQGTTGNPIATPMLDVRDIRKIKYEKNVASAMDKWTLDCGAQAGKDITLKIVIRTTPTAQLNFHDPNGSGLIDLSGAGFEFPLSAFNNTHHKVITVQSTPSDAERATTDNESTLYDALKARVEQHALLNKLVKMTDNAGSGLVVEARHAGVMIEVLAFNDTDETAVTGASRTTAGTVGVGNPWQVLSEEIRCRSRYGNFNRMYIPQNMPTYTNSTFAYDKITVEYEHNWPNSTGIAPAGALNQAVIYLGDSSTALAATDFDQFEAAFNIALATNEEFVW